MKKNLFVWQLFGITFTAILGTILHFLYQWTNLTIVAPISAVNESTWEHMKLVFIPSLIFSIVQYFITGKEYRCFWLIKLIGIILATILTPVLFYTLSGSFGKLSAITNIAIFFISIFIGYLIEYFLFKSINCKITAKLLPIIILLIVFIFFIIFTFYPPKIPLFLDPVTNGYGITK